MAALIVLAVAAAARGREPVVLRADGIDRPLRYTPDQGDFVIENGTARFNRPLYTAHTPARVDAGDRPEFAFLFPNRNAATKGGVLRFGIAQANSSKWLAQADKIIARYHPGSMIYEIHDALIGDATLTLTALPTQENPGLVVRALLSSGNANLIWSYGGGTNETSRTNFDLVGNPDLGAMWNLTPNDCQGATVTINGSSFAYHSRAGTVTGSGPTGFAIGDSSKWNDLPALLKSTTTAQPVSLGNTPLRPGEPIYISIQHADKPASDVAALFNASEDYRKSIANQVTVDTPDPFINSAIGAICIAANDIYVPTTFMHGANAWHTPLLGWRGPYAMDALGWHDRAEAHLSYWAGRQNTNANDVPTVAVADPAKNLGENDWKMLHSYGNIPQTHYDMDLPFIDELYWHFFWTGDLAYVKKMWPVITRHLAWEKRCFDRDGLYEGYACIWASDGLEYNGGGAAHSTAYNYLHNLLAARMARAIGEDPAPYDNEARRIHDAMQNQLWIPSTGVYGEYKDILGLKRVHPDAAIWTVYHSIDSQVPDPLQAWQLLRYVDTHIPHIPIRGPGVPAGDFHVVSESDWQPYEWSLNNVVMAEVVHTALANWQAGRPAEAWNLFKGTLLDGMYMGICPGDLPNLSYFDEYRGESYRDFGDPTGITSRTFVQGLFGILPNAIAGELTIRPGFPPDWDHASISMPDVSYSFRRDGTTDHFTIEPKFPRPMTVKLILPARLDHVESVEVNGKPSTWTNDESAVGTPRMILTGDAPGKTEFTIHWSGNPIAKAKNPPVIAQGETIKPDFAPAKALQFIDPQKSSDGVIGHRTAFEKVSQGDFTWTLPIEFEIRPPLEILPAARQTDQHLTFSVRNNTTASIDGYAELNVDSLRDNLLLHIPPMSTSDPFAWNDAPLLPGTHPLSLRISGLDSKGDIHLFSTTPVATEQFEPVDLTPSYNDKVTQIFRNEYLSPRSPYCSLQIPKQGIGVWSTFNGNARIDDSGLRRAGGHITAPGGIPFNSPAGADAKNILFTSQWDNYPKQITVPLSGSAKHAYLLMAGSTNPMESGIDNGEVIANYSDGTTERLALRNPDNWWPIDQDYLSDDFAFRRDFPVPPRLSLLTGKFYVPSAAGGKINGGAATVFDMPLDATKTLQSLTLHTLSNEVVIGLMSLTLAR
jgi:hypothetical protein